ncbi:hypothetical protein DSO57_1028896 [Entomophthora muscae]|uniref:Uncharacterized protein n=1 Tax=Entomophthora muscae TaxID=34485 RepID=A0ACC2SEQ0_9FUNG|nr:hypothetical protein DSO57_1028896 [Entomophthora muscae]
MELNRKGVTLFVDTLRTNTSCDHCRAAHIRCEKGLPSCERCLNTRLRCTYSRNRFDTRLALGFVKEGWTMQKMIFDASTWAQVIANYSPNPMSRSRLWLFLLPLELILPLPTRAKEMLDFCPNMIRTLVHPSETRKYLHLNYPEIEIQAILDMAIKVFFHLFNPFYPIFSQKAFHSRPRSCTLKKIVTQIGLERMPQSELVKSAMDVNHLTHKDIYYLPNTLDTLQCLLLAQLGIRQPWIIENRIGISCLIDRLSTLLGLHISKTLSPPLWIERKLALHLAILQHFFFSGGTSSSCSKFTWLETNTAHLYPTTLTRLKLNDVSCFGDQVHFFTGQTICRSKAILLQANTDFMLALQKKSRVACFLKLFETHLNSLNDNFIRGWNSLMQLTKTSLHPALHRRSRLALALHCNADHIELLKTASYIPSNSLCRISSTSLTCTIDRFSLKGLDLAIRTIQLLSTISLAPFGIDVIHILILAISYAIAHFIESKRVTNKNGLLVRSLSQAVAILNRAAYVPFFQETALAYKKLIAFLLHTHDISLIH